MKHLVLVLLLSTTTGYFSFAQEKWELKKNKNSVQVWTKDAPGWDLRQYRAICQINANAKEVYEYMLNWEKRLDWYADINQCKQLHKKGETEFILYEVYDAPWPVDDRDVVSKVMCMQEEDGSYLIQFSVIPNYIPRNKDFVRIEKAIGTTRIKQLDENTTEVTMSAKSNTGGEVPEWLANMFIEDSPFTSLTNLKKYFEEQN